MKESKATKGVNPAEQKIKVDLRRWILKAVSGVDCKTGATLPSVKKFLDSKQAGISNRPEMKVVLKRLVDTGHLVKIDGKYAAKGPSTKRVTKPSEKAKSVKEAPSTKCVAKPSEKAKSAKEAPTTKCVAKPSEKAKSAKEAPSTKCVAKPSEKAKSAKEAPSTKCVAKPSEKAKSAKEAPSTKRVTKPSEKAKNTKEPPKKSQENEKEKSPEESLSKTILS